MRQGMTKEIDWVYMGAILAGESAEEQRAFFRGFIKECLSWGTRHQVEQQLAVVNRELTSEERDVLSMLSYNEK